MPSKPYVKLDLANKNYNEISAILLLNSLLTCSSSGPIKTFSQLQFEQQIVGDADPVIIMKFGE
jgi:hypothetical protein